MPEVVSFAAPYEVALVPCDAAAAGARVGAGAHVVLRCLRGHRADGLPRLEPLPHAGPGTPDRRLFVDGAPTFAYPVEGWGYSEVGEVVEVAADVARPAVGDLVHGIWGHRSEAVLPAAAVAERLWTGQDPVSGTFARVGSIALNAAARRRRATR